MHPLLDAGAVRRRSAGAQVKVADAIALRWGTSRRPGEDDFTLLWRALRRSRVPRRPRALDMRGFRMTRREAAGWIRAAHTHMDLPPDSHPSLADNVEAASRDDLIQWSRAWRRQLAHEVSVGATKAGDPFVPLSHLVQACLLAAARGPDFWRPRMCVMQCGRPATWIAVWSGELTPTYCDECSWPEENVESEHAPRIRALWKLATEAG